MEKVSIIIPTFNKLEECLHPCLESIIQYTDLHSPEIEVVIVANGCTDGTEEYIKEKQKEFSNIRLLWFDKPLGYVKPINEGIKASKGDYFILLNNDTILLNQPQNQWIDMLLAPFLRGEKVGLTGPMKTLSPSAGREFLIFFCVMLSRELIDTVGPLDEAFFAYGEDTDICCRAEDNGFKVVQVPTRSTTYYAENRMVGLFPIFHKGNVSFKNWPGGEELLSKNNKLLEERYKGRSFKDHPQVKKAQHEFNSNIDKYKKIARARNCDGYMSEAELLWLAERAEKSNIFIEVGSWHGKSSRAIADNLPENGKLYCVDHWLGSAVERTNNHASAALNEGDHAFMEFCDNLSDHISSGKVIPLRMHSKNAADFFKKNKIKADTVFIDAGHTEPEVEEDINLWYPIVDYDKGGVLCGHDYNYPDGVWDGVTKAVNKWFKHKGTVTQPEGTNIWSSVLSLQTFAISGFENKEEKIAIYDCFPFFNELDVLDIRFAELFDTVDRFVIVEATLTHGGQPKPLYFKENLQRYEKYLHKVTHIVVDSYPSLDSWSIERHQRDQIMRGLTECKDSDVIIVSDCDEIPRASSLREYKAEKGVMALEQQLYYYKLNCASVGAMWDWAKIVTYRELKKKSPCEIRYTQSITPDSRIQNGGWHFSYMGNTDDIIHKIEATAHQEYNKDYIKERQRVESRVEQGKDIFDRPLTYKFVEIGNTYPKFVLDNIESFDKKGLIHHKIEKYEPVDSI